ncbi:YokU family protein [Neobacillus niacini]|uniref:YokU family protein n=1 Tax=Neobacillus niacini TaxID=86668 RepID=UPI0021CB6B3F|nr:YokU family protein [Neobacillus niacini]MCM3767907.1 YokU family protein [Neobacillus niacini]
MLCEWCNSLNVTRTTSSVYWELPDGTGAIEITNTPTLSCPDCSMTYQSEPIIKEIEDQLFLIDCKRLGKVIPFEELMEIPRLLKKNYFDFSS